MFRARDGDFALGVAPGHGYVAGPAGPGGPGQPLSGGVRRVRYRQDVFGADATRGTGETNPIRVVGLRHGERVRLAGSGQRPGAVRSKGSSNCSLPGSSLSPWTKPAAAAAGASPDGVVSIGYNEVEPADIEVLRESLNLSEVAASTSWNVARHYRENWLREFMALSAADVGDLAGEIGVNLSALQTLHRRLLAWERFGFLAENGRGSASAGGIIEQLERGNHVVLEFGQYGRNTAAYVLVSNLLTRRIHETWVRRKESADGGHGDEPRPLVIFVEEAHKFLTPDIASQTIFGAIARELRKYNVTLMIVDQRPSGIDSEVMSQLGTRLSCALNDDRDMNAVLMGARDAGQLRNVLSRLDSKQQALVFGHAVPMPVVVRPRDYDEAFYADMGTAPGVAVSGTLGGNGSGKNAAGNRRAVPAGMKLFTSMHRMFRILNYESC